MKAEKLRWRCRRGRRELDLLLQRYLSDHYGRAGAEERACFEKLLERSDPELEDLLTGRMAPGSAAEAHVVERIRGHS